MEYKKIEVKMQKKRSVPKSQRLYGKGDEEFANELIANLDKKYPYEESVKLPLESSVSVLLKKSNADKIFEKEDFLTESMYDNAVVKSTDLGIAYHLAMQCLDVDGEADFLQRVHCLLSSEQLQMVDERRLLSCRKIILDLIMSKPNAKLHKEQKFIMYIPYNEIFEKSQVRDCVLIQGIIDLFIEFDDEIILVDYKTNKTANLDKLKENYAMQMTLYAKSLQESFNKKVTAYLYGFATDKLILC